MEIVGFQLIYGLTKSLRKIQVLSACIIKIPLNLNVSTLN